MKAKVWDFLQPVLILAMSAAMILSLVVDNIQSKRIDRAETDIGNLRLHAPALQFSYAGTIDSADGRTYALLAVDPPRIEEGMYSLTSRYEVGEFSRKLDTIRVPMTVTKTVKATGKDAEYYYDRYGLPRPGGVR